MNGRENRETREYSQRKLLLFECFNAWMLEYAKHMVMSLIYTTLVRLHVERS